MMKTTILGAVVISAAVVALTGCAPIQPIVPGAQQVIVSPNPPPKGCKYLGAVVGNQGNFFTGGFTSNSNLEEGSLNAVRNKAATLGANYVQMVTNRAGVTGSVSSDQYGYISGGSQETNVVATGNAYKCPAKAIGE